MKYRMKQRSKAWSDVSIRHKVMAWVVVIMMVVAVSVGASVGALDMTIRDYETISIDNYKCYEVQKAMEAERDVFLDLTRDPSQRNRERFRKACLRTRQCIDALPMDIRDIGEDRYARTWNLRNGYDGYVEYRDAIVAMDPGQEDHATQLYRVIEMQDSLSEYSLRLIQETMEYGNRHYNSRKEILHRIPVVLIGLSFLALAAVFSVLRLLTSMVVSPILLLAEEARHIAANNFSRPDLPARSRDEIGLLLGSFNRMKHAMADYIATRERLHQQELSKMEMEKNLEQARLEDAGTTDRMIVSLGNLFRYNLRTKEQVVYLEQELEALDDYLYIQQMRYDGRITCRKDIRVDPFAVRIPSFTLQPIVENALSHGMKVKEEGGRIHLKIWQEGQMLTISVMDNGTGMSPGQQAQLKQNMRNSEKTGRGIGLGNLYHRMAMLYPRGALEIYSREGRGTVIQIKIPQSEEREGQSHEI